MRQMRWPKSLVVLASIAAWSCLQLYITSSLSVRREETERSHVPDAWIAQMNDALEHFADGIKREDVEQACPAALRVSARVAIIDNRLYLQQPCAANRTDWACTEFCLTLGDGQQHAYVHLWLSFLCQYKVPDIEFVWNFGDGPRVSPGTNLPIFSWARTVGHWDIPMFYFTFAWARWADDIKSKPFLTDAAWSAKKDVAYWRGGATGAGGPFTKKNWRTKIRAILVKKCLERPDLCDAALVDCAQCDDDAQAEMALEIGFGNRTKSDESPNYKYTIMVDGNTSPSSRAMRALQEDSLVLFQENENFEFWYTALRPYVHYVPLSRGLEDLHTQIEWSRSHEVEVKQIVRNAQQFSRQYLTAEASNAYLYELVARYAALQRYTPNLTAGLKKGFVWLNAREHKHFMGYMNGRCHHWKNEPLV